MDSFSWSDGVQAALSSCLPCFVSKRHEEDSSDENDHNNRPVRRQLHYDELEGLLGDVEETDIDAETVSLHSNIGRGAAHRKKKKRAARKKSIKLFGFDLFGRPPIQLPESEDEADAQSGLDARRRRVGRLPSAANSSSSTSAFDSDAAPLDPSSIARLAAQDQNGETEEETRQREERKEREERRRRRREHRELRRKAEEVAAAAAMGLNDDGFEGFQGSGHGSLRSPFSAASTGSGLTSPSVPGTAVGADEYGPFVSAANMTSGPTGVGAGADDPADAEADFGGEAYAQKLRRPPGSRGSDSSRSHSLSQTSASVSNADPVQYNHHYLSQQGGLHPYSPLNAQFATPGAPPPMGLGAQLAEPLRRKKKKRSTTSESVSTGKRSNSPTSQSTSLPSVDSPVEPSFGKRLNASDPFIVEHEEHPGGLQFPAPNSITPASDGSKFPSVGFGGVRRTNSAGLGASFLARTGDE